ncbi:cytochrome P450 [Aspergillus spectabilis]
MWTGKCMSYTSIIGHTGSSTRHVKGIPELPNAVPFYGHLKSLGVDHASAFQDAYTKHNHEVVQAKLVTRRVLVLNSFEAAQEFIVKNASATIDKPLFYTFHGIVSTTQCGTIGTSPWNDSTKRMRTTAGALMRRPAIRRSASMVDLETSVLVEDLFKATHATGEVDPRIFFQRQALNLTLMWCYWMRIASAEGPLPHKILHVAHSVSSKRAQLAMNDRTTRDLWLNELFQKASEIKPIDIFFVSGGFETLATSGLACLGLLSTNEGQEIQEKAYNDIITHHSSIQSAWFECLLAEKSPYVVALVREGLRFYTPSPSSTPPNHKTIHMARISHDAAAYGPAAHIFPPERWLEEDAVKPPYQYSFGAGSRMCPAVGISNRILYATYVRLIVHFRVLASEEMPPGVGFNEDPREQPAILRRYRVKLVPRQGVEGFKECVKGSSEAMRGMYE